MTSFSPPFCPNAECVLHQGSPESLWWRPFGSYSAKTFGLVPRFRCSSCGKTFSVQTFSPHYYAKRMIDLKELERRLASSMSVRALSRDFACSCGTILNRTDRIARQGIALHSSLRPLVRIGESICYDDLVSFDCSQYFPNNIGISITADKRFVLAVTHVALRRSGAMREAQKQRRDALYKGRSFERGGVTRSFGEHLSMLARERKIDREHPLVLITDEKIEYQRALHRHRLFLDQNEDRRVAHVRIPSTVPRTYYNPLFPSNYFDREVRKDQANHRRETTCFSRNAANMMNRLHGYSVYHNYEKRYLINESKHSTTTHAEEAGIDAKVIREARLSMFTRRAFLSRLKLDPIDRRVWMKETFSPEKGCFVSAPLPHFAVS